eukprot:6550487-Ditylum_brightwellii.AAC.1
MTFGVLGATEHVASTGDVSNCLIILSAQLAQGVHSLFIDFVTDKIGGHGLVMCSTDGCFGFTMETCSSQPLMGLCK